MIQSKQKILFEKTEFRDMFGGMKHMKKTIGIILGLAVSVMMLFAFAGCGDSGDRSIQTTPADEAAATLDTTLAAFKTADMDTINSTSGGETFIQGSKDAFGSEEQTQDVLNIMFGHFDYQLGTPEQVDDTHVNVPATVSNVDMSKAVNTWYSDFMNYVMENPSIANDEAALSEKNIEMLKSAVDKTAEEEGGIMTTDVTFPMELTDGQWTIGEVDENVPDAMVGGFMSALEQLGQ